MLYALRIGLGAAVGAFSAALVAALGWISPLRSAASPWFLSHTDITILGGTYGYVAGASAMLAEEIVGDIWPSRGRSQLGRMALGAAVAGASIGGGFSVALSNPQLAPAAAAVLGAIPLFWDALRGIPRMVRRRGLAYYFTSKFPRIVLASLVGGVAGGFVEGVAILILLALMGRRAVDLVSQFATFGLFVGFYAGMAMETGMIQDRREFVQIAKNASEAGLVLSAAMVIGAVLVDLATIPVGVFAATTTSIVWSRHREASITSS